MAKHCLPVLPLPVYTITKAQRGKNLTQVGFASRLEGSWKERLADSYRRAGAIAGGVVPTVVQSKRPGQGAAAFVGTGGTIGGKGQRNIAAFGIIAKPGLSGHQISEKIVREATQVINDSYQPLKELEVHKKGDLDVLEGMGLTRAHLAKVSRYRLDETMAALGHYFPKLSAQDRETVKSYLWHKQEAGGIDIVRIAAVLSHLLNGEVQHLRNLNRQEAMKDTQYQFGKNVKAFQGAKSWEAKVVSGVKILGNTAEAAIDQNAAYIKSVSKPAAELIKQKLPEGLLPVRIAQYLKAHPDHTIRSIYYTFQNLDPTQIPASLAALTENGAWKQVVPGIKDLVNRSAKGDVDAISQLQGASNSMLIGLALGKIAPGVLRRPWSEASRSLVSQSKPAVFRTLTGISDRAMAAMRKGELGLAAVELGKKSGMRLADARRVIKGLDQTYDNLLRLPIPSSTKAKPRSGLAERVDINHGIRFNLTEKANLNNVVSRLSRWALEGRAGNRSNQLSQGMREFVKFSGTGDISSAIKIGTGKLMLRADEAYQGAIEVQRAVNSRHFNPSHHYASVGNFINKAIADRRFQADFTSGHVSTKAGAQIKRRSGLNIDLEGSKIVLNSDLVRHGFDAHGNEFNGQVSVQPRDFDLLDEIINYADEVVLSKKHHKGVQVLVFEKRIKNSHKYVVSMTVVGRSNQRSTGALRFLTMAIEK